jgi:hypothetical protein
MTDLTEPGNFPLDDDEKEEGTVVADEATALTLISSRRSVSRDVYLLNGYCIMGFYLIKKCTV